MIYLLLAVLSSAMISVLMRVSEKYSRNNISMLAMNYVMCCALGMAFAGPMQLFPAAEGLPFALALGIISGVLYLGGFVLFQWNIARNGVVLPATFMKLGILVPTLMSILIFGESPRITQLLGVAAAVAAIVLIQGGGASKEKLNLPALLILLLTGGLSDGMSKIFEELGPAALKNHFLLYIFMAALLLCVGLCIYKRQGLTPADAIFGLILGVPNYLSSRFLLLSLADVPAMVAFPSFSVGTILLAAAAGVLLFKEKLSRRKCIALAVILVALVLLNV